MIIMFEEIKQQNKRIYLQSYAKSGSVKLSNKVAGISYGATWFWRQEDEEFAEASKVAEAIYRDNLLDELEAELKKRSLDKDAQMSTVALFFALKAEHPDKYREKVADKFIGEITVKLALPVRQYEALPESQISIMEGEVIEDATKQEEGQG